MSRIAVALWFVLAFAGCTNTSAEWLAAECLLEGNHWRRVCIDHRFACIASYADAGKSCTDSSDCMGNCVVDLTIVCDENGTCPQDPEIPASGASVVGVCER